MRHYLLLLAAAAAPLAAQTPPAATAPAAVEKPAALTADGIPAVPADLADRTRPYGEARAAGFQGWHPVRKSALILTRFGNTAQVHEVARPMGDRRQVTFEADAIGGASVARRRGDVTVIEKDVGGSEFYQLYRLENGRLQLLTDGRSRNSANAWTHDGRLLAYTSTRRNGTDNDIYVMDPRDPKTDRLVAQLQGGGWRVADFSPDGRQALVARYNSVEDTDAYLLDVATGRMTPIGDHSRKVSYGGAEWAPDGTLYVASDEGSDFQRLGTLDVRTGRFSPIGNEPRWDVDGFRLSPDGRWIAYLLNEAGIARLKILDLASGRARAVTGLPVGTGGGIDIAEDGTIGLTVSSARAAADVYAVNPRTLAVTRWTQSETGGLDPLVNVEPELIEVKSFDGEAVSGFLYRPDPRRFPGRRPLVINIHGGPEGQSRPGFQGRSNYYYNELGVAIFFPNVRGSTGFGKRFVALDNGPNLRENSVQDIGAFLDRLQRDPRLDAQRTAVTGGSYGGYMCYASAIRYGDRLKAANCIVAISDFNTFLENTQSYRRDLRRVEYGDERDPAQRAKLAAISPLTRSRELRIPLMVVTGGNDPRVPASEADQMVKAVRANGQEAWHLLAADEGHGFAKKANQDYQFWTSLMFWQRHLLGDGRTASR